MFTHKVIVDNHSKAYYLKLSPTKKLYNKDYLETLEKIITNQQLEKYLTIIFHKNKNEITMCMYIQNKMRADLKNEIINYIKCNDFGLLTKTDIDYMYGQTIYRFKVTNSEILLQLM
jgi:hypothetical protein